MAGLLACVRNAVKLSGSYNTSNTLPLLNKKISHQIRRSRHSLIYQLPVYRTDPVCKKLLQTATLKERCVYRLASTHVTSEKITNPPQTITEVTSSAVKNNEAGVSDGSNIVGDVDDLPPIPSAEAPVEVADFIAAGLKEPTFESLGLAKLYKPSGIIQYCLEYLHVHFDLPWWAAISSVTLLTRLLLLPVSARLRKNAVLTKNNMPELQKLQREFTDARHSGNYYDAALAAQNLQVFMKEKGMGMSTMLPMLIQVPVFLTVFFGLKGMKEVESLKTGGMLWFTDLTQADPYYILPLLSSATAFAALQIGAETGKYPMPQQELIMKVMKIGFPVIIFVATFKFPTCLVFYWTVSNLFTLALQLLFLIRPVARFFNIPDLKIHPPSALMQQKKGIREGFKETLTNLRVTKELAERERLNTTTFEKAGVGPIPRTFKTNPKAALTNASGKNDELTEGIRVTGTRFQVQTGADEEKHY